jgi:outer membrane protein assembly factor BamA
VAAPWRALVLVAWVWLGGAAWAAPAPDPDAAPDPGVTEAPSDGDTQGEGDVDPALDEPVEDTEHTEDGSDAEDGGDAEDSGDAGITEPGQAEDRWLDASGLLLDEVDLTDPLGPVEAVLEDLARRPGIRVTDQARTIDRLRGETLTARIEGVDGGLLQYMLERIAEDGYQLLLEPVGERAYLLIALRSRPGQGRGLELVGVDSRTVEGTTLSGETTEDIAKLLPQPSGGVLTVGITEQLAAVGYRAALQAAGPGRITVQVSPGRAIRRVRVHGHVPLSEREVRRVLSPQARPGALAPGNCLPPKDLRYRPRQVAPGESGPPVDEDDDPAPHRSRICTEDDLACREWERTELHRLERFLFDNGYLAGRASLAFACGDHGDEVDLHVTLRKGQAYRVGTMKITGNLSTQDQRWIRRVFRPTVSPFIPIRSRITRKHVEEAKERAAREYAEPRSGPGSARRQLKFPYPGVRIDTDFDRRDPKTLPPGRTLPLEIDVQLGQGVKTEFLFNDAIADNRLRGQLQLWKRREPANAAAAQREAAHLRGFYQSRGFMLARVEGSFEDFGSLPTLRFAIAERCGDSWCPAEGPRVKVREAELIIPPVQLPPEEEAAVAAVIEQVQRSYERQRKLEPRANFTDAHARDDLGLLLAVLADAGYLCAQATMRVAFWPEGLETRGQHAVFDVFTELDGGGAPRWLEEQLDAGGLTELRKQRRAGVYLRIEVVLGPRVVTSGVEEVRYLEQPIPGSRETGGLPVLEHGAWGKPLMLRDSPLRRAGDEEAGDIPVYLTLDREVERDIVRRYRASGYPLADVELRWRYVDAQGQVHRVAQAERLATPEVGLCREQARQPRAPIATELAVYEGRVGRFGTTLVRGNFKTRRRVLVHKRTKTWKEAQAYDRREVDETRRNIEGMGVTESVQIRELEVGCHLDDDEDQCVVHHVISVIESKDRALDVTGGIGGATLDPFYVFLRPTLPNMLGTAWDLNLDGHFGFGSTSQAFCGQENCYERSGRVSLSRRRIFASPLTFEVTGQVQRRLTPARGQIDSVLGQARFTWPINKRWRMYSGYLVQVANISKDVAKPILGVDEGCTNPSGDPSCRSPNRREAIVPDRTGALQAGAVWQRVDNAFNPEKGVILTLDGLFATPSLGRDWWLRGDVAWQQFVPIPRTDGRLNFRYSLRYGHALPLPGLPGAGSTSVPEIWRYFGGGTIDLGIRGIEPQTMLVDVERIPGPYGTARLRPVAQGGHIRALGTVALQVVSVERFLGGKLAHSVFMDLGVLTQRWSQVQLGRDLRRSVGVNFVKWDIKIVTVSVGYAVLVPDRIWPGGNVGPTDDRNGRFVFDVGATF